MMSNQTADSNSKYGKKSPYYAGDVSAQEAWEILQQEKDATLIDVRTEQEWKQVGTPNLISINKHPLFISWRLLPQMELNASFVTTLSEKIDDKKTTLLFLCRSGGRSAEAASVMTRTGYVNCYNVGGGVEGIMSANYQTESQAQTNNGWKAAKLPWEQK
jgi:rhodanese-related sulfurtransferase